VQVPEPEKSDRLARLQALLTAQQAAFQAECVGRTLPVLIEKPGRHPGQMVGRSPYLQAVHLDCGPGLTGRIADSVIVAAATNRLSGRLAAA
jgi:tRNA-2-methylthio-N6-dimethylallyladenosine synthase